MARRVVTSSYGSPTTRGRISWLRYGNVYRQSGTCWTTATAIAPSTSPLAIIADVSSNPSGPRRSRQPWAVPLSPQTTGSAEIAGVVLELDGLQGGAVTRAFSLQLDWPGEPPPAADGIVRPAACTTVAE